MRLPLPRLPLPFTPIYPCPFTPIYPIHLPLPFTPHTHPSRCDIYHGPTTVPDRGPTTVPHHGPVWLDDHGPDDWDRNHHGPTVPTDKINETQPYTKQWEINDFSFVLDLAAIASFVKSYTKQWEINGFSFVLDLAAIASA